MKEAYLGNLGGGIQKNSTTEKQTLQFNQRLICHTIWNYLFLKPEKKLINLLDSKTYLGAIFPPNFFIILSVFVWYQRHFLDL